MVELSKHIYLGTLCSMYTAVQLVVSHYDNSSSVVSSLSSIIVGRQGEKQVVAPAMP